MNDEMIEEFKIEAAEMFESAEEGFLNIDRGEDFITNFNLIFRSFHSLKGAAGMFGLLDLQSHMHKLESLFETQKRKGAIGKSQIDYFLSGIDVAKAILDGDSGSSFKHFSDKELDALDGLNNGTNVQIEKTNSKIVIAPKSNLKKSNARGLVYIVDDEEDILDILQSYIEEMNFDVKVFNSAQSALNSLNDSTPDIILSDISMPNIDGIEFVKRVRQINQNVTFIMISGNLSKERILDLLKYDVTGFVEKPFLESYVKEVVEQAFSLSQLNYLLHKSINYILYQFSDLDNYLKESGKENMRISLKEELKSIIRIQSEIIEKKKKSK